jgi:hypothetical protein
MTFAVEGAGSQDGTDGGSQGVIGHGARRSPPQRLWRSHKCESIPLSFGL